MYPNIYKRWLLATLDITGSFFINGLNPWTPSWNEDSIRDAFSTYPMVWIQSRLLWNPEYSVEQLLADYTENSFGPAAETMSRFYGLVISRWEGIPWHPDAMDELEFIHRIRYDEKKNQE